MEDEQVFIVSWVGYCSKYGMGYALTDGSVGVHFNDSTSLVLSGDEECVFFVFFPFFWLFMFCYWFLKINSLNIVK